MQFNYGEACQVILALIVIIAVGYLCGGIKMFKEEDAMAMRDVLFMLVVPGLLFRQIGLQKLTIESWHPFLNELLTQLTIHAIVAIICFAFPFKNKMRTFVSTLYASSYKNYVFMAYPMVQIVFGNSYTHIPTMMGVVQYFILIPIHSILTCLLRRSSERGNEPGPSKSVVKLGFDVGSDEKTREFHPMEDKSLFQSIIWKVVNPMNICIILGIIWSATSWKMPLVLDSVASYLEKAVMAAGLFVIGVLMWNHCLFGCNWLMLVVFLLVHFVAIPAVSALWSWLLKVDRTTAVVATWSHVVPPGLMAYGMIQEGGFREKLSSFVFFWSNVVSVVFLILWIVVFNEAGLFAE